MKKNLPIALTALLVVTMTLLATSVWAAPREKVLYNFNYYAKGWDPSAGLIFDGAGNLYGTTIYGGAYNLGTVFELTPKLGGGWSEKVLHSFDSNGRDGVLPFASLTLDAVGNLYGTTQTGGLYGSGTVFELTQNASGDWTERILHNFNGQSRDGAGRPDANLIFDAAGNLYGTTYTGGTLGGTVFELTPKAQGGGWTGKVLHHFGLYSSNGTYLYGGVILDAAGNLYGTTVAGGDLSGCNQQGCGTVFELTPQANAHWKEKVLHRFRENGKDGINPTAALVLDAAGNLYGTTSRGGAHGGGTAFELTPKAGGRWTEEVLHNYDTSSNNGGQVESGLIFDAAGNLYGTTVAGGVHGGGTVFELMPKAGGGWTEKVLHSFNPNSGGLNPLGSLIFDALGNLYGTTANGGAHDRGTVFEITP